MYPLASVSQISTKTLLRSTQNHTLSSYIIHPDYKHSAVVVIAGLIRPIARLLLITRLIRPTSCQIQLLVIARLISSTYQIITNCGISQTWLSCSIARLIRPTCQVQLLIITIIIKFYFFIIVIIQY